MITCRTPIRLRTSPARSTRRAAVRWFNSPASRTPAAKLFLKRRRFLTAPWRRSGVAWSSTRDTANLKPRPWRPSALDDHCRRGEERVSGRYHRPLWSDIINCTLATTGNGVINVADFLGTVGDPARISTTFDGFDAGAITTSANVELADGSTLELRGAIANTGNIGLNSTGDATQLVINSLTSVTLSG